MTAGNLSRQVSTNYKQNHEFDTLLCGVRIVNNNNMET